MESQCTLSLSLSLSLSPSLSVSLSQVFRCPILVPPDNGEVVIQARTVGSTARYSCFPGYVLQGRRVVTCLDSGVWDGEEPVCVDVFCPDLPDPANGEVTLSGNTFGSTASYR